MNTTEATPSDQAHQAKQKRLPTKWMDVLWQKFADKYQQKFTAPMVSELAIASWKLTWSETLYGATGDQLNRALSVVSTVYPTWPPTDGEFKNLIWPTASFEDAFKEAARNQYIQPHMQTWSSKVIYWAARSFDKQRLLHSTWNQVSTDWVSAMREMMAETTLPEIPTEKVPELPPPMPSREVARPHIDEVMDVVGVERSDLVKTEVEWAMEYIEKFDEEFSKTKDRRWVMDALKRLVANEQVNNRLVEMAISVCKEANHG